MHTLRHLVELLSSLVKAPPEQRRVFITEYRLYRRSHTRLYAARIAYGIVFQGLPF